MSVVDTVKSRVRRYGTMVGLGLLGVAGLAVATGWRLSIGSNLKPGVVGPLVARQVVVPGVLVIAAGILGAVVTERLTLRSHAYDWAKSGTVDPPDRDTVVAAVGVGIVIGAGVLIANAAMGQTAIDRPTDLGALLVALPGRLLYLGITEEILFRWGFMSTVAYLGLRWFAVEEETPAHRYVMWGAVLATALVLPAIHLARLSGPAASNPLIVLWILGTNGLPGVVFGALYWKRSLEVAMIAHLATHLPLVVGSVVLA